MILLKFSDYQQINKGNFIVKREIISKTKKRNFESMLILFPKKQSFQFSCITWFHFF